MMAEQEQSLATAGNPPTLLIYIVVSKEFLWRIPLDAANAAKN
jgi:hypothetical protein